jgi:hypothetical protein
MKPMELRSRWVLVTGASSGLGWAMAGILAREYGANLVLVARRKERLRELSDELRADTGVDVLTIAADLSRVDEVDRVVEEATRERELYAAILNAGVTHFGHHHELTWENFETMLATNVTGVVRFATQLVPYFEEAQHGGGLLFVSSLAGITPVPYQTAYSGTKAFLVNYGLSLHHELEGRNVSVTVFVPGGIRTEMTAGERFGPLRGWLMPVDKCAREALRGFVARRYLHAPGLSNRVSAVAARMLPTRLVAGRVGAAYRNALEKVTR